jgi:hypothetical protein
MYRFAVDAPVDVGELREHLRKMSDADLRWFGRAAEFMCSPGANGCMPPRECFVIQLEEAKVEWRWRARLLRPATPCVPDTGHHGGSTLHSGPES